MHELDTAAHKAQITIAGCKIDTALDYAGDTSGEYSDSVTLAADLGVSGSDAPLPFRTIAFQLGSQTCSASADADGHAECSITLDQVPGTYTVGASFAGSGSLEPASDSASFTIEKEKTALAYGGPTEKDYHDVFTAKATLLDEENVPVPGRAVAFTLGATDTCSDNTDGLGVAECSVAPNQVPGSYTMTAAFAGDAYYEPSSDADSFTITKEETVTTYNGPTVILQGASGVTLAARLLEGGPADTDGDGSTAPTVPSGQTVTLRLGSQSCSDTVDASGSASCTLTFTGALGSQPLEAEFGGDAYYLPSADTGKTAIVFAFPSRGAFVLGDNTVAAATPTSAVTWWDDAWWRLNSVSSGVAPDSFKGFAGSVITLPTTSPANACGTTFRTLPGNSPPPTSGVPSYMGVLVASSVTKSGNAINGRWGKIVVVRTNAGYAPNPGRQAPARSSRRSVRSTLCHGRARGYPAPSRQSHQSYAVVGVGCFDPAKTSSSPSASTRTTSPSTNRPSSSSSASGFSSIRWIARFSGRAPYAGSQPGLGQMLLRGVRQLERRCCARRAARAAGRAEARRSP